MTAKLMQLTIDDRVLLYLCDFIDRHGISPRADVIALALDTTTDMVCDALHALEKCGYIKGEFKS